MDQEWTGLDLDLSLTINHALVCEIVLHSHFWLQQEPKESRCRLCVRDIMLKRVNKGPKQRA